MNFATSVLDAIHQRFYEVFGDRIQTQVELSRFTSARVGGPAEMFLTVNSAQELQAAVELAYAQSMNYFILGGGSNILVSDKGVRGLVIFNRAREVKFRSNGIQVICIAESGANLSSLARQCIAKGLGGLEWAVNIPGTVGELS
ncbi:MAG: FAD-binding protein [Candidatus Promineifilaceae bacterium]